jgi:periplasmic divalent cation tolerance protein
MDYALVYVTVPSLDEARTIALAVVEERLAACANLVPRIESIYWWEDTVEEAREVLLLLKTKRALVGRLGERIRTLHSYECPCVVSLDIAEGHAAFLEWIGRETLPVDNIE